MRRKEKSLRDVESRRRWASYSNWGILTPQKAKIFNNVKGEKLFYFSFSKKLRQQQPKKKKNPQPQLMTLLLISLKKEKKQKRTSICFYHQVNLPTWMDGLCSQIRLTSSFMEHSLTSRLCFCNFPHPLCHQLCYCYGMLWVIFTNTQHTNM